MLLAADTVPRKVRLKPPAFDLDLSAIGPKTRLVIVNTSHNPTGRIYDRDPLKALSDLLDRASAKFGRRIFLLTDEPYRRLRFDGRDFVSPAEPNSEDFVPGDGPAYQPPVIGVWEGGVEWHPRDHTTNLRLFAQQRNPQDPSQSAARLNIAIQLFYGVSLTDSRRATPSLSIAR